MKDRDSRITMSEKGFKELATKGASVLSLAALAAATGCSANTVDAYVPTEVPESTIEPFPTPSPEFVLSIEKYAQESIDTQFEGLGIHDTRLIGDVLTDASGQNRFALFESQLPNKQTSEDMSFLMIAAVGQENKIESVRGLVASEAYPQEGDILAFASVTFDAQTQIFEIQDPYVRTNTQTGEIEIATDGRTWVPLLASPYTYNEVRATLGGGGILAARALPTPTAEPTVIPTEVPLPTRFDDERLLNEVIQNFLERTGYETLEEAYETFMNSEKYDPSFSFSGLDISSTWTMMKQLLFLGTGEISISHIEGARDGDTALIIYAAEPTNGTIVPIVGALELSGTWHNGSFFAQDNEFNDIS